MNTHPLSRRLLRVSKAHGLLHGIRAKQTLNFVFSITMTTTGSVELDHLARFMERSERHMKEVTEALATLNQKYDRLSTRVQWLESEFSKGHANGGGAPPPPPPPHAMDNNSYRKQQRAPVQ